MRTGVTAVHVGEDVRSLQIADPRTRPPGVLHFDRSGPICERILNSALEAAKLTVREEAKDPGAVELPIITKTDRSEPAVTALTLTNAERRARSGDPAAGIRVPDAAAGAAEDVEAGPARQRCRRGRLGVGVRCHIGGEGRTWERRDGGESEHQSFHRIFLSKRSDPIARQCWLRRFPNFMARTILGSLEKAVTGGAHTREKSREISIKKP